MLQLHARSPHQALRLQAVRRGMLADQSEVSTGLPVSHREPLLSGDQRIELLPKFSDRKSVV